MSFKNKLDELTAAAALKTGLEKQAMLQRIREYLYNLTPEQIIREATEITNPIQLRVLVAVGIPGSAYRPVIEHIARVTGPTFTFE
jgi:hypothetical protein